MTTISQTQGNSVAIIGVACRMPGALNAADFWKNLTNGVDSISTFSDQELLESGVDPDLISSPQYVRSRGIIGGAAEFDAAFFGFTPRDAELLDPQQRHFLQCAWHALEDAGYYSGNTDARIGVYGGVGTNWHLGRVENHPEVMKFASGASVVISNDKDYLTTRVSYKLDLRGPSVNVQSACSTSLVATVLGMNDLLDFKCDMVLAGGATIEIPEKRGYLFQEGGMESKDGRCRPFDAKANGTVFSRGVGVVLLKRLVDAIEDRDNIYAVIRGGAVNNDGSGKVGYTAPSVQGQVEVATEALESAGVDPRTISFVEAHGTATPLGDPIEVNSLSQTFRNYTDENQFCALGSVKGNIGHTDVASGAAGLIKSALALKFGKLPASLHYQKSNPAISFEDSPFFVNTELSDLSRNGTPLRGLLNSFGVGGTNACLILEEPPQLPELPQEKSPAHNVLVISAANSEALDRLASKLDDHLEAQPELDIHDVAFTCQVGRKKLALRRSIPFSNREELRSRLSGGPGMGTAETTCFNDDGKLLFAFPGQGNQYLGMGRDLYAGYDVYRETIDTCCEILKPVIGIDLREIMFAEADLAETAADKLNQTYITQPSLFVTSYAMAKLWMSWGLRPDAMVGHSVGEYVAACLAGVFSLEDALLAVATRGKLIQDLPGGSMLAVLVSEAEVLPYLPDSIKVAAVNSPKLTVVSGPTVDIEDLENTLKEKKVFFRRLATSHAFHSAMMDPALPKFAEVFETVRLNAPSIPIASTVTGKWLADAEATDPNYWVQHVRRAVRFSEATEAIFEDQNRWVLLESGPGHSLESSFKAHMDPDTQHAVVGSMRTESEADDDANVLLGAVGRLWAAGKSIDWSQFYGGKGRKRVSLPGYPFERQEYALDFSRNVAGGVSLKSKAKPDVSDWFCVPTWKRTLEASLLHQMNVIGDATNSRCEDSSWLIFNDGLGLGDEVCRQLQGAGAKVIKVGQGEAFAKLHEGEYQIRPDLKEDYDTLIAHLKTEDIRPARVLHLWNVDDEAEPLALDNIDRRQTLSFFSPIFVQQAFISQNVMNDLRIIVCANGVFDVTGEPVRSPEKALALGPCRVLGKEFTMIQSRFVDLEIPSDEQGRGSLANCLVAEAQLLSVETAVAIRKGHRWTETFEQLYLEAPETGITTALKDGGAYLITGGLGALGLLFALQIAQSVKANLILVYRSRIPERSEWDAWLANHPEDNSTSEKIRGILGLEQAGANVMLALADSSDLSQMEAVVQTARQAYGQIDGVIHAAGIAGGGIISLKTQEMAEEVFAAKVTGTLILDQIFRDTALDFTVLFSSVTSYLGEIGRVDYCAANSFMDAMAHYRNQRQTGRLISLNWPGWNELGMAARWEESVAQKAQRMKHPSRSQNAPALQLVGRDGSQEIYDVLLDPEVDWVINEHMIFEVPTLVGAAFFDLCHQFADIQNPGGLPVLENVYFLNPLMFPAGQPKRVRLFVESGEVSSKIAFRSQRDHLDPDEDPWEDHFIGMVRVDKPETHAPVDIDTLKGAFDRQLNHSELFDNLNLETSTFGVQWSERWNSNRHLVGSQDEWVASLELPEKFGDDLTLHRFHPALLDIAFAAAVSDLDVEQSGYLPFSYRRIKLHAPLSSTLHSHIRLAQPFRKGDDIMTFDITLYDEAGNTCVEVERYGLKNLSALSAGQGQEDPADVEHAEQPASATKSMITKPDYIFPADGLDAFSRVLTGPFVPQLIISTRDMDVRIKEEFEQVMKRVARKTAQAEEATVSKAAHLRPTLSTPYVAPENEIESAIAEIWQGVLGIDKIGVNDNFTELGGNSLLAVQTIANISEEFRVELTVESFSGDSTVASLAASVLELLIGMTNEETLDELISTLEV